MAQTLDELVVKLSADLSGFTSSMNAASSQVAQFSSKTTAQLASIETALGTLATAAKALGIALGIEEVVSLGKNMLETSMKVQALQFQLIAATGSTQDAAAAAQFAAEMADKYGFAVLDVEKQLSSFLLATRNTTMTLQESEQAFEGVSVYARAMGLTANNVTRGMIAFQEIMGQGNLRAAQMQMLIRDLHISYQMMADSVTAAGGSVEKLKDLMKKGAVDGKDAIVGLTMAMREQFGTVAQAASQSLEGNLNRLNNQWVLLQTAFGQSGGLQAANVAVHALSDAVDDLIPVAVAAGQTFLGLEIIVSKLWEEFQQAANEADGLADSFIALFTALGGLETAALQFSEGRITAAFDTLKTASQSLSAELDKASADEAVRAKKILDDYNATIKAITTPYSYPDINRPKTVGKSGEGSEEKGHKVTQNQVDAVEKYAAGDDEGEKLKIQLAEHQATIDKAYKQGLLSKQKYDDDMEALQQDFDKRMGDYVAKEFGTEIDKENQDYKDKLSLLKKALKEQQITQQQYDIAAEKLDKEHKTKLIAAQNAFNKSMRSDLTQAFDGFLGVQTTYQEKSIEEQGQSLRESIDQAGQHNRAFFELSKAAAIAQALIKARQSVVDAYQFGTSLGGPALGAVFAGVAAAAQAANVAAIASTSFSGSGSVSSTSASAVAGDDGTTAIANNNSTAVAAKNVTINLQGRTLFSKNDLRDLIDQINDVAGDGYTLNFT